MMNNPDMAEYEMLFVIVHFGLGSKVLKIAKHNGISGGVACLGTGTEKNRILEFLELADERKEIVILASDKSTVATVVDAIDKEFHLEKPHHGIAFTMPLCTLIGRKKTDYFYNKCGGNNMYNLIVVVVDCGKAEIVVDCATDAGARGGTIIKARGSGINETSKLFNMDIEPEKEIVIILSDIEIVETIVTSVRDTLGIGKDGSGAIFCNEVNNAYGLYK